MQLFTAWQYLMIDVANQFGLDKKLFNERIKWAEANIDQLEAVADQAETQPLYLKAVQAIRKVQRGEPTGHQVGFDAACSGIQIMSAMTGCEAGARATGLINPAVRADAYALTTDTMNGILGGGLCVPRADAKSALMTSFYGSKKTPKTIFGEDTPELFAFYDAAKIVAPGAWDLLQSLLASWQPYALSHEWKLPDGYDARVLVMDEVEARIEVDELDHATFTYRFEDNIGTPRGRANAANVVHSVDAYVLRGIQRRCNYNPMVLFFAGCALRAERDLRAQGLTSQVPGATGKLAYYLAQYERSTMADVVILPFLQDGHDTQHLSDKHIEQLLRIVDRMDGHKSFEVVTIHDDFKCHPNNMNHLRQHYIDILAELSESEVLSDILSQIHGKKGSFPKLGQIGDLIRQGNYALS